MQFRAGILYVVLFVVIAAGAYGVIATAESPELTIDEADADFTLSEGDELEVDGQVFNVSQLADGQGTVEQVDEDATLDVEWEDGERVPIEEDVEYILEINQPDAADEEEADEENGDDEEAEDDENGDEAEDGENGDEAEAEDDENGDEAEADDADEEDGPESFTLREDYDEDEYETVEREDGIYVVVTDNDSDELVHIDDFDEIDSQVYEVGDSIEFYDTDSEENVEGEVTSIGTELVVVEYTGVQVTEFDLENANTVTLNNQEFGVYFPSDDEVYLTSNLELFNAQLDDIEEFSERVHGLWWVVSLSALTGFLIGGLAFMPVRG